MTHEQFEKAANYWKNKEQTEMPAEELKKAVEEYISANNTCALATGIGNYVRCTCADEKDTVRGIKEIGCSYESYLYNAC